MGCLMMIPAGSLEQYNCCVTALPYYIFLWILQWPLLPTAGPDVGGVWPSLEEAHRRVWTAYKGKDQCIIFYIHQCFMKRFWISWTEMQTKGPAYQAQQKYWCSNILCLCLYKVSICIHFILFSGRHIVLICDYWTSHSFPVIIFYG